MPETSAAIIILATMMFWAATTAYRPLWRYALTHLVTFVHELGHAIVGFFMLRGVGGIRLHFDGSGETRDAGHRGIPGGRFLALIMGYPASILLGAFLLGAVAGDYMTLAMKIMLFFGVFTLIFIRNLWGLLVVLGWIALSAAASFLLPESLGAEVLITFIGSFFIVGGMNDLVMLGKQYVTKQAADTDLGIMQRETFLPKWVTFLLMLGISFGGGWWVFKTSASLLETFTFLAPLS